MSEPLQIPDTLVADAVEAYDRYRLACMLGVLGKNVQDPGDCPAQVMPRWLARLIPGLFDRQAFADAKAWGLSLYEQLARLEGQVPFSVVYDWQATCVLEFWAGSLKKRRFDAATMAEKLGQVERLQALHRQHLAGGAAPKADWLEALRPVFRQADADADADAYADGKPTSAARRAALERKRTENLKLLADGLVAALSRAPAPEA